MPAKKKRDELELIPIPPLTPGGRNLQYMYVWDYNKLPSYWTIKYRWLRENKELFQRGKVEIHRKGKRYTYQYIPKSGIPKCMLVIDPKKGIIYTTKEEIKRLTQAFGSREQAIANCRNQASAFISLVKKLAPPRTRMRRYQPRKHIAYKITREEQ